MKHYVLIFKDCCFYEIVILSYFLKYTNQEVLFCSLEEQKITCMEGFTVEANCLLQDIDVNKVGTFIIPGGEVQPVKSRKLNDFLHQIKEKDALIAAICAGVDVLDEAGLLKNIDSTHSNDQDCVNDKKIITARANAYVDFAIEVAKEMNLFENESDLNETIDFWKYHKSM
ncbi:MAG: DJ-1/PfpI family protein [Velocimicrobium sp.]